jgi:hypothetical protein
VQESDQRTTSRLSASICIGLLFFCLARTSKQGCAPGQLEIEFWVAELERTLTIKMAFRWRDKPTFAPYAAVGEKERPLRQPARRRTTVVWTALAQALARNGP